MGFLPENKLIMFRFLGTTSDGGYHFRWPGSLFADLKSIKRFFFCLHKNFRKFSNKNNNIQVRTICSCNTEVPKNLQSSNHLCTLLINYTCSIDFGICIF